MLYKKHVDNIINVAVGILLSDDNEILVQRRQLDKKFGGKIEFPAGKVEFNETIVEALAREINEEIGVEICDAAYLNMISFKENENIICLHFFIVTEWEGDPISNEGQDIMWCNINYALKEMDFMEMESLIYDDLMSFIYPENDNCYQIH